MLRLQSISVFSIILFALHGWMAHACEEIEVSVSKLNAWRQNQQVGELVYLGGSLLGGKNFKSGGCSGSHCLGGYSGLVIDDGDGRSLQAIMVSDQGHWLKFPLHPDGKEFAAGAKGKGKARRCAMPPLDGQPEGLRRYDEGWLVLLEDKSGLALFDKPGGAILQQETRRILGDTFPNIAGNKGPEGVVVLPNRDLLMFIEGVNDDATPSDIWRRDASTMKWSRSTWPRSEKFRVTDAVVRRCNTLIVLERYFAPEDTKASARIRWVKGFDPAKPVMAKVLASLAATNDAPDNLEGIDARCVDGKLRLYLVSDDNPQLRNHQKTILLVFQLNNAELNTAACG